MKNVHLNKAFGPTPPCIRTAIEQGFERGEKRMLMRYRLRVAFAASAAALLVCGIGLTALHSLRPSPDRVQYAQGSPQQPLTALNQPAGEELVAETPFTSADDVATVRTLPYGDEEAQSVVLAQPEVAAAGTSFTASSEEFAARTEARKNKNWAEADRIRDELKAMGIVLEDTAQGVKWHRE